MKNLIIAVFALALGISCKSKQAVTTIDEARTDTAETRNGERGKRGQRGAPPSIDEVFRMDVNNDGLLSTDEVEGRLAERFAIIDANADGFISREEFENAPKPKRGKRQRRNN